MSIFHHYVENKLASQMSTTRSASIRENELCERDCCYCSVSQLFHTLTSKHKQRHVYYYIYYRHVRQTKTTTRNETAGVI